MSTRTESHSPSEALFKYTLKLPLINIHICRKCTNKWCVFSHGKLDPGSGAAVPTETAPKLSWFIYYSLSNAANGEINLLPCGCLTHIRGSQIHSRPSFACKTVTSMFILLWCWWLSSEGNDSDLWSRFPIKPVFLRVFLWTSVKAPHHDRLATSRRERNFLTLLRTRVVGNE